VTRSIPVTGGDGLEPERKNSSGEAATTRDLAALRRAALRWFLLSEGYRDTGASLVGSSRSARGGVGGGVRRPEIDDFASTCDVEFVALSSQTKEGPRGAARTQEAEDLARVT